MVKPLTLGREGSRDSTLGGLGVVEIAGVAGVGGVMGVVGMVEVVGVVGIGVQKPRTECRPLKLLTSGIWGGVRILQLLRLSYAHPSPSNNTRIWLRVLGVVGLLRLMGLS